MANKKGNEAKRLEALSLNVITKEGYLIRVIEYFDAYNCTIQFVYNARILHNVQYSQVKSGEIRNVYHKSNNGVGYTGDGVCSLKSHRKAYQAWSNMLTRGYSEKYKNERTTYKDVTVCEEWHNFQNFAKWFEENYIEGWHLDKDIICPDCKIYSPETCIFVPRDINILLAKRDKMRGELPIGVTFHKRSSTFQVNINKYGKTVYIGSFTTKEEAFYAYKKEKENYIKEVSEIWKSKLNLEVYQALINYRVKITD